MSARTMTALTTKQRLGREVNSGGKRMCIYEWMYVCIHVYSYVYVWYVCERVCIHTRNFHTPRICRKNDLRLKMKQNIIILFS